MLELLDSIFLQSLMQVYTFIFNMLPQSADIGTRLIIFSVIINLLLMPVYLQMERHSSRLQDKRNAVTREVQRLKKHFKGRERYFYIRTLYKQQGVKHFSVLFNSGDLFVQILVFATVFRFISSHEALPGQSFGPIADLSMADGLLGGINLLPILMTAINILSLLVYASHRPKLYQGLGLAAVFLVLLYPSPSGLVLYWTANNLFSLIRNIGLKINVPISPRIATLISSSGSHATADNDRLLMLENGLGSQRFTLFILAAATTATMLFLFVPITTFLTSPGEIGIHLDYLLTVNARNAMTAVYLAALLYALCYTPAAKTSLTVLALGVLMICILYTYVLPFGYPMLTGLAFELPPVTQEKKIIQFIADIAIITLLAVFLRWLITRFGGRSLVAAILLVNASLISATAIGILNDDVGGSGGSGGAEALPETPLRFSQSNPNVLIIFLDRFMGSHVEKILDDEPALKSRLSGFVWYPRSVSAGENSIAGVHPLYGGYDYTPDQMNARNALLRDLSVEAFSILPYNFSRKGYQVNFVEPNGLGFTMEGDCKYLEMPGVTCSHVSQDVVKDRAIEMNFPLPELSRADYVDLLVLLSLMRTSPYTLKNVLHEYGPWRPFMDHSSGTTFAVWSKLKAMPELSMAEAKEPNFNIFTNILPHEPYYMWEDCVPREERFSVSDDEVRRRGHTSLFSLQHEITARCSLLIVADYLDFLKKSNVYDNTEIVIVSDHGIVGPVEDRSSRAIAGKTTENLYVRSRSVLLVKKIGSSGELKVSEDFMPNAEVPRIVCEQIGGCINPYLDNKPIDRFGRNDPFLVSFVPWQFSLQRPKSFVINSQFELTGKDPYEVKNWRRIN